MLLFTHRYVVHHRKKSNPIGVAIRRCPQLLVLQRAAHEDAYPHMYELPGGNWEKENSTILHTVAREALEETVSISPRWLLNSWALSTRRSAVPLSSSTSLLRLKMPVVKPLLFSAQRSISLGRGCRQFGRRTDERQYGRRCRRSICRHTGELTARDYASMLNVVTVEAINVALL